MMLDIAFGVAVALAAVGALAGNRTAWALLASAGLCQALDMAGVSFALWFWVAIDLAVIAAIIRPAMNVKDCLILALFVPAWALYFAPEHARYVGTTLVVISQLLLAFPASQVWHSVKKTRLPDPWDGFDMFLRVRLG